MGLTKFGFMQEFAHRLTRLEALVTKWNDLLENLSPSTTKITALQTEINTLKLKVATLEGTTTTTTTTTEL